jgi:2-polyprenyl-3-methyl-5-hydroxy-6-metoxy-1,4-benzoquinol methylase
MVNDSPVSRPGCALCGADDWQRLFRKQGFTFVRCRGCGLVSVAPLPSVDELRAHHEHDYRDGTYAAWAAADDIRTGIARERLATVLPLAPPGPWLEIGCSTGAFLAAARSAGMSAEGLDVSDLPLEQARARGLVVHHSAVEDFVPPRRYGMLLAFDVIEHLPDPLAFVRRVTPWLSPRGVLVLTLPNAASPVATLMRRFWFQYVAPDHLHYFTPATITRLLARAQLEPVRISPVRKPLTLDYTLWRLGVTNPGQARLLAPLMRLVPARLRARVFHAPLGEMVVVARGAPAHCT